MDERLQFVARRLGERAHGGTLPGGWDLPSARGCHLCSRYVLQPMCPGWTDGIWRAWGDLNARPLVPETSALSN